jgi:hypothetical protein
VAKKGKTKMLNVKFVSVKQKLAVWNKGSIVDGFDATKYRQDIAGAWMAWDSYGDTSDELGLGWEIDHRKPESDGGSDDMGNLRPLQWANNRSKGNDFPKWTSIVSSSGTKNVYHRQTWTINN